jgi:uncharacterized membrane protein
VTLSAVQNHQPRWLVATYLIVVVVAAGLRLVLIDRQGLWADEVFSLAMATGHSLEHPASQAKPELGDYVEAAHPRPASEYKQYLQHQEPPVGPAQVLRAVRLSDTSPPLYYLLLWAWTRLGGTSDFALRFFTVCWALACFPLMWSLAQQIGGTASILPAGLLFAISPLSIYYSLEGRMYAMLWFLALSLAWLTLKLMRKGPRSTVFVLWICVAAAGLLTHYFYIFVVAACSMWLLLYPGKFSRVWLLGGAVCIVVLIAPWYSGIADSVSRWRVTKDWLYFPLVPSRSLTALMLPWTFVSPSSDLWQSHRRLTYLAMAVFSVLLSLSIVTLGLRLFTRKCQLLWIWLAAACVGLLVFDHLMGTYTTAVPRYAIAGMPAALLLVAVVLGQLRAGLRTIFIVLILVAWMPSSWTVITNSVRAWEPFRQLGSLLEQTGDSDVVVVHSIPSGVLGIARYVQKPVVVLSWVGQLQQRRVPEDIEGLLSAERIIFIKVHEVGEPAPEQVWLRNHTQLVSEFRMDAAEILFFMPAGHKVSPAEQAAGSY